MRYTAEHKEATRARLLEEGRQLAKRKGFATLGVDAMARAAGLSGPAFYGHFESKADFFAALIEAELDQSERRLTGRAQDAAPRDALARRLARYLGEAHADQVETGCVLPALGAEIARADPATRARVEDSLQRMHEAWGRAVDDEEAWGLLALAVGAQLLARMVGAGDTRHELLAACRAVTDRIIHEQGETR